MYFDNRKSSWFAYFDYNNSTSLYKTELKNFLEPAPVYKVSNLEITNEKGVLFDMENGG